MADLPSQIEELWSRASELGPSDSDALVVVSEAIDLLDRGEARVAEVDPTPVRWWSTRLKHAILLLFRLRSMETLEVGPFEFADKLPLKKDYAAAGVRVSRGRRLGGARSSTTGSSACPVTSTSGPGWGPAPWWTPGPRVGSCRQIGEQVHLSGGVGIGGVLEPAQAAPVVIEDEVMIGSRSMINPGSKGRPGVDPRGGHHLEPLDTGHRCADR